MSRQNARHRDKKKVKVFNIFYKLQTSTNIINRYLMSLDVLIKNANFFTLKYIYIYIY